MWFKNLRIFRFTQFVDLSPETLEKALEQHRFRPCAALEFSRYGWVSPMGKHSEMLTHSANGQTILCARKQEKILPAGAINELVDEKVAEMEVANARSVYRKEKLNIKDDVIHTLLPRALTRSAMTFAYIVPEQKLLIIDAASPAKAEELMEYLRAALGSLPVAPLSCHGDMADVMTRWLKQRPPVNFDLDDECELRNARDGKNIVRCKNQELESDEVEAHLKAGKRVTQLALNWKEAIQFVLCEDFSIKRLRFSEMVQEQADTEADADDFATRFDQDFVVMSLQLNQLIDELIDAAGGANQETGVATSAQA
jgi:recombination associated protein RdgC